MVNRETLEIIRIVFAILHDGLIQEFSGDKNCLRLKIKCQYLAERLSKNYEFFYVELRQITKLELTLWTNPPDRKQVYLTEIEDIFATGLEITSAKLITNYVEIDCDDMDGEFHGGFLSLACENIRVFDHESKEISVDELESLCRNYWEHFQ